MAPTDARKAPLTLVRQGPEPDRARDDARLVEQLRDGDPTAPAALFDAYGALVNRVLYRVLGGGADHDDRVQETFLEALRSLPTLRDDGALRAWITTIAVRVARAELRRRRVRRFLRLADDELPEPPCVDDHAAREALRATWKILDALPTDERLAFTLRFIEGEELTAVADACGCSLATVKRWLARAEQRFVSLAMQHPELARRLAQGGRWSPP
ncbi:MAG: sigma-70 family RNA polymerase sigma factor [Polyangiales bacterium]